MNFIVSLIISERRVKGYAWFAEWVAGLCGRSFTFAMACLTIFLWIVSGPYFGYSDTWQLVINTGTTIITFLMMFVLQNTQERDTKAVQRKLDALLVEVELLRLSRLDQQPFAIKREDEFDLISN
jgi:low affinity Fe/Cu permease